ncbi:MAG: hypothetical protein ACFB6R_10915 [Alphaproteobacteria bacterium]
MAMQSRFLLKKSSFLLGIVLIGFGTMTGAQVSRAQTDEAAIAGPAWFQEGRPPNKEEWTAMTPDEKLEAVFIWSDGDMDGALNENEFAISAGALFDVMDINADARLERDEFARPGMIPNRRFKRADTNKNGAVDPDEYTARAMQLFDYLDTNKDEAVTIAEVNGVIGSFRRKR